MADIQEWRLKIGIPADFWMLKEKMIGEFIKANKLKAVAHESLRVDAQPVAGKEKAIGIDYIINIRGGRRTPHLHYKGELFLLDAKQWQTFSGPVMKEFSKQLAAANTVGFENFMEIGDSLNAIH
jgi:hypothetical protein